MLGQILAAEEVIVIRHAILLRALNFFFAIRRPPTHTLFPYTTLFRSSSRFARADSTLYNTRTAWALAEAGARLNDGRSEEHTSELQSHHDLVCRLLLEKKKTRTTRVPNVSSSERLTTPLTRDALPTPS